ncbi:MAG: glycosyltransferase involved in cell wall biosynthesis [Halioglobus sp.]|jgi:glycosyltransferase involved in cell wall biosynthesis
MVTTFYPPYNFGGDGTYVRALSEALVQLGHEVTVVHCEDAFRLKAIDSEDLSETPSAVRVIRLKSKGGALSPMLTQQLGTPGLKGTQLKRILGEDYDVVNFHNISLVGGPGVLRLSKARVTLYTLHEHWLLCPTHIFWKNKKAACESRQCIRCSLKSGIPPQLWRYTPLFENALESVDSFIAPSEYTAARHRELLTLRAPIEVMPLFSYLAPEDFSSLNDGKLHFVSVGRMTASKGIGELVESFSKWPEFALTVIGDGELLADLKHRYGDCLNITFTGAVAQSQLITYYRNATALILPSLAPETFGLTVVEAFACGTPSIVRSAGGNRETIDRSGAGFLYDDEAGLRQAVQRFADNPELRVSLGAQARGAFEAFYTAERHISNYLDLVDRIRREKAHSASVG